MAILPNTADAPPDARLPIAIPRQGFFFLLLLILMVGNFILLRLGLEWRNPPGPNDSAADIARAFWIGIRFDFVASAYILLPFLIVTSLPWFRLDFSPRHRRRFFYIFAGTMAVVIGIALGEYEFFHEFQSRYNQLAVKYLDQIKTVTGMVYEGFPVFKYGGAILLWAALFAAALAGLMWVVFRGQTTGPDARPPKFSRGQIFIDTLSLFAMWVVVFICLRGGVQHEPIRWGDASKSATPYANEMGHNGVYTLGRTVIDYYISGNASRGLLKSMPADEARTLARQMVFSQSEASHSGNPPGHPPGHPPDKQASENAMTRVLTSAHHWLTLGQTPSGRPPNVVVVLMESFSARFCGAVGCPETMTPEFDALAKDGVLFSRAFSAGTHTHQGVFSSLLGFPNLPGYEDLMQDSMSRQPFSSIPSMYKKLGYQTLFLYNGNFDWDNMYGMFRDHGIDRFFGWREFSAEKSAQGQTSTVWGANDHQVFQRANQEFEAMSRSGPFCGVILTLSNHAPFELPKPLPFNAIVNHGELDSRLNGVRYADWAVGQFIEDAKKLDYFKNTLFVFVGDHGFAVKPVLTDANVLYHHVPLLFYSPLLSQKGVVRDEAAMQANIAPTLFGLTGMPLPVASWGRDLFSDDYADENFAYFKDSGGGKALAIVQGKKLLCIDNVGKPRVYDLSLAFPPSITPVEDPALSRELERKLRAYVVSALTDLMNHNVGPTGQTNRSEAVQHAQPPAP